MRPPCSWACLGEGNVVTRSLRLITHCLWEEILMIERMTRCRVLKMERWLLAVCSKVRYLESVMVLLLKGHWGISIMIVQLTFSQWHFFHFKLISSPVQYKYFCVIHLLHRQIRTAGMVITPYSLKGWFLAFLFSPLPDLVLNNFFSQKKILSVRFGFMVYANLMCFWNWNVLHFQKECVRICGTSVP